jgi:hypothetical protein
MNPSRGKRFSLILSLIFNLVCMHVTCTVHVSFTSQSIPVMKLIIYLSVFTGYFISDQKIIISIEVENTYLIFCFRCVDAWADNL